MQQIKNRSDLAKYFNDLGFKTGAEIGVLGGGYSLKLLGAIPELKLYCIDSWGINEIKFGHYHNRKYAEAKLRLGGHPETVLIKDFSLNAVKTFNLNSLDFVFIDANHSFDFVMRDIIEWGARVKRGGIISGHDYLSSGRTGVKDAVDIYVKAHNFKLKLTNPDHDHGVVSWWILKK